MTLHTLTYVSVSLLDRTSAPQEVAKIVDASVRNNSALGVTGALIFTGANFVQILEAGATDLKRMMEVISADPRHSTVHVASRGTITRRRFPNWRMAYVGPSTFIDRRIHRLIESPTERESSRVAEWLQELLIDLLPSAGRAL